MQGDVKDISPARGSSDPRVEIYGSHPDDPGGKHRHGTG
jgi:hypothetical protein